MVSRVPISNQLLSQLTLTVAFLCGCDAYMPPEVPVVEEIATIEYQGGYRNYPSDYRQITTPQDMLELLEFLRRHQSKWSEGFLYDDWFPIRAMKIVGHDGTQLFYMQFERNRAKIWSERDSIIRGGSWQLSDDEWRELFGYLHRSTN